MLGEDLIQTSRWCTFKINLFVGTMILKMGRELASTVHTWSGILCWWKLPRCEENNVPHHPIPASEFQRLNQSNPFCHEEYHMAIPPESRFSGPPTTWWHRHDSNATFGRLAHNTNLEPRKAFMRKSFPPPVKPLKILNGSRNHQDVALQVWMWHFFQVPVLLVKYHLKHRGNIFP